MIFVVFFTKMIVRNIYASNVCFVFMQLLVRVIFKGLQRLGADTYIENYFSMNLFSLYLYSSIGYQQKVISVHSRAFSLLHSLSKALASSTILIIHNLHVLLSRLLRPFTCWFRSRERCNVANCL